jgi:hypothetical protein
MEFKESMLLLPNLLPIPSRFRRNWFCFERKEKRPDIPFYVTAKMGHQWWGHQVANQREGNHDVVRINVGIFL